MKRNYAYLKAIVISFTLLFGLEYLLIVIFADYHVCFWHNTIAGNIVAWTLRIVAFGICTSIFSSLLQPAFKTLRERMLEKEQKSEQRVMKGAELTLDQYLLRQAR